MCTCSHRDSNAWRCGLATIDEEFIPPRTWHIQHLLHGWREEPIVECDTLLLDEHFYRPVWRWTGDIWEDHGNFYSRESLLSLGAAVGVHAVLANTSLDEDFRNYLQDHRIRDPYAFDFAKYLGEAWIVVPTLAAVWVVDSLIDRHGWLARHRHRDVDDWSSQSLRALIVGAPVVGGLQVLIGASRPRESSSGSKWRPFQDNNGASGHAFLGAVPLLVAAKHVDNLCLKAALVAGSVLPGYSRLHEDQHYLSQVMLGWWIAHLAVDATEVTERSELQWRLVPLRWDGVVGIGLECRR